MSQKQKKCSKQDSTDKHVKYVFSAPFLYFPYSHPLQSQTRIKEPVLPVNLCFSFVTSPAALYFRFKHLSSDLPKLHIARFMPLLRTLLRFR